MGRRKGPSLTMEQVVNTAVLLVQEKGVDALKISRVAHELGIKPASMYNHVASGGALTRAVVLECNRLLLNAFKESVRGVFTPYEQLRALANSLREWARHHTGLYVLMNQVAPCHNDPLFADIYQDMLDLFTGPLGQLGIAGKELIYATRGIRSAIHGFVLLEICDQFQLEESIEDSYRWLLESLLCGAVKDSE